MIVEETYEFNIGDAVVVKSWEEMKEEYPLGVPGGFPEEMHYLCGEVLHIKSIDKSDLWSYTRFRSEEDMESKHCDRDRGYWVLTTNMVRPAIECDLAEAVPEDNFLDILNAQ